MTANVLITGVSRGIGRALVEHYLSEGCTVFGTSRRAPDGIQSQDRFRFAAGDLQPDAIPELAQQLCGEERSFDLVILNAGILGKFSDLIEADLDELNRTFQVNVWANKLLLDEFYRLGCRLSQVVTISSGASVNGNRGWSGYAISKAALNMLTKLYATERPETHFCAFAPGIVDTAMQENICGREPDERFPSIEVLRSKRGTSDMPDAETAAPRLAAAFARLPDLVESGDFADIRSLA